ARPAAGLGPGDLLVVVVVLVDVGLVGQQRRLGLAVGAVAAPAAAASATAGPFGLLGRGGLVAGLGIGVEVESVLGDRLGGRPAGRDGDRLAVAAGGGDGGPAAPAT